LILLEGQSFPWLLLSGFSKQCVDYKEYGPGFNRILPSFSRFAPDTPLVPCMAAACG
jgi:hypothetical protein